MNHKNNEEQIELDEKLLDSYSEQLEKSINLVINNHNDIDSRPELLLTLVMLASQVAQDMNLTYTNFLELNQKMFNQLENMTPPEDKNEEQNKILN